MKIKKQLRKNEVGQKYHILRISKEDFLNLGWDEGINCSVCSDDLGNKDKCNFYLCETYNRFICRDCEFRKVTRYIDGKEEIVGIATCPIQASMFEAVRHKEYEHEHALIKKIKVAD